MVLGMMGALNQPGNGENEDVCHECNIASKRAYFSKNCCANELLVFVICYAGDYV